MRVHLLGTAAGGGFPQWNCNCTNCAGLRARQICARPRSQSCVALTADTTDDARWFLLNASPDLRTQIEHFLLLAPPPTALRGTRISAVLLTDADLDHTLGLFLLREGLRQTIYATPAVQQSLAEGLALPGVLSRYCDFAWREPASECVPLLHEDGSPSGLLFAAFALPDQPPRYMAGRSCLPAGHRVGYRFVDERTGGRLLYLPGVSALDGRLVSELRSCDALLLDGTFWSEDEMQIMVDGMNNAASMGHLPVGGVGGSLEYIAPLPIKHKIYVHINNTNPMLIEDSKEHLAVRSAGAEVGWDGLELIL